MEKDKTTADKYPKTSKLLDKLDNYAKIKSKLRVAKTKEPKD